MKQRSRFSIKRAVDRELLGLIGASNRPIQAFPPTVHEPPVIPVAM